MKDFISGLPKAELHLHLEGTLEPELMFKLSRRNNIPINYQSAEELKRAYNFNSLQEFLNIYYAGSSVLINEIDFYELTSAYLEKAASQNVIHCEMFFDPQTHTKRGVKFETVVNGICKAIVDSKNKIGINAKLILCLLRDLDEENAMNILEHASAHKDKIIGVGLDSAEVGNPPVKFANVFKKAKELGFIRVAHAGEEGPSLYVWEALNFLEVSRIDHGNKSINDQYLLSELARTKIPLTICPLSNLKLQVVENLKNHPLKEMMKRDLLVTVNSDDPAYFGGYINENYYSIASSLNLTIDDVSKLAKNSIKASFITDEEKELFLKKIDDYTISYWDAKWK